MISPTDDPRQAIAQILALAETVDMGADLGRLTARLTKTLGSDPDALRALREAFCKVIGAIAVADYLARETPLEGRLTFTMEVLLDPGCDIAAIGIEVSESDPKTLVAIATNYARRLTALLNQIETLPDIAETLAAMRDEYGSHTLSILTTNFVAFGIMLDAITKPETSTG